MGLDTTLVITAVAIVGLIVLAAVSATRTTKLNVDPLQNHLMRLIQGLNENGHTPANRERFSSLAAGYFQHYRITRPSEHRTRLAHAFSFVRLGLMPDEAEQTRLFLRTWRMPKLSPQTTAQQERTKLSSGPPDVFLSYAREDRENAQIVVAHLEALSLTVWWDDGIQTGQRWENEIKRQLELAGSVIVLWTGFSTVSEWVRVEASFAKEHAKLAPAFLRQCRLPKGFADLQTADLSDWDGDPDHTGWVKLVGGVRAIIAKRNT